MWPPPAASRWLWSVEADQGRAATPDDDLGDRGVHGDRVQLGPQVGAPGEQQRRRDPGHRPAGGEHHRGLLGLEPLDGTAQRGVDPRAEGGERLVVVLVVGATGPAQRGLEPGLELLSGSAPRPRCTPAGASRASARGRTRSSRRRRPRRRPSPRRRRPARRSAGAAASRRARPGRGPPRGPRAPRRASRDCRSPRSESTSWNTAAPRRLAVADQQDLAHRWLLSLGSPDRRGPGRAGSGGRSVPRP